MKLKRGVTNAARDTTLRQGGQFKRKWCRQRACPHIKPKNLRLARTIGIYRVGQNHIYTVYIRFFWQGNHQIYGHIRAQNDSGRPYYCGDTYGSGAVDRYRSALLTKVFIFGKLGPLSRLKLTSRSEKVGLIYFRFIHFDFFTWETCNHMNINVLSVITGDGAMYRHLLIVSFSPFGI
jgi:hypothetical protein